MPLYEVEHVIPLTPNRREELAKAITEIHTTLFTTPSLFVNIRFTDTRHHDVYIGGKKSSVNRILAHVRPGGGRTTADVNNLCAQITEAWERIVGAVHHDDDDRELRAVFVLGTIIAGSEAGFALPPAGEDKKWLKENMGAFREKAEKGDREFKDLVKEMETRGDLRELL